MLKTVIALAVVFTASNAIAKCSGSWVKYFPEAGQVPRNAQIVVTLGVSFEDDLQAFDALALVSGKDRVPVKVVATYKGMMQTQLVLKATSLLQAGLEYHLGLPEKLAQRLGASPKWRVEGEDKTAPVLDGSPVLAKGAREELGCGPDVTASIGGLAASEPALMEVTLTSEPGAPKQLIAVHEGGVDLGHGMCSGAFKLVQGKKYVAEFVAVDFAGNRSATSKVLSFVAP